MSTVLEPTPSRRPAWRRMFRRGPWENVATLLIAAGVVMLVQPVLLVFYTYSFITMLAGTVMFIIVSKFPE